MCVGFFFVLFCFWLFWVFIAAHRLFSICGEWDLIFIAVHKLLIVVASLIAEHGLWAHGLQWLQLLVSRAQAQ